MIDRRWVDFVETMISHMTKDAIYLIGHRQTLTMEELDDSS